MIFDLTKLDYTIELTDQLKKQHYERVNELVKSGERDNKDGKIITLYHGTTLKHFNSILLNGLQPRAVTKVSNFKGKLQSVDNLVYLTSKWHYWYAYSAFKTEFYSESEDINVPCYVDVEVLSDNLVIDEDFFHSKFVMTKIKNALKKHQGLIELNYQDCISQYGTVAHIGAIDRDSIKNLTILASKETLLNNFINSKCQYMKDLLKWGMGKGKGSLKLMDLFELEDHKYNLIFDLSKFPPGFIIERIIFDNEKDTYRMILNTPEKISENKEQSIENK